MKSGSETLTSCRQSLRRIRHRIPIFSFRFCLELQVYYGIIKESRNDFWLVFAFFVMTGLAIIFYLNQYPNQPRERDYAYAGSFYAFAIWIGLGFMFVYENLQKATSGKRVCGSYFCRSCFWQCRCLWLLRTGTITTGRVVIRPGT